MCGYITRAAEEGVQGVKLHPIQKLGGANISFCIPKTLEAVPTQGLFGVSPIFLESLRFSPGYQFGNLECSHGR